MYSRTRDQNPLRAIQSGELAQPAEMLVGHPQKTLKISEAADLSVTKQEVDFSAQGSVPTGVLQALNRPFVGRQLEVKKITALLAKSSCWLVTLIGPGGIGKTRLALEVGLSHQKHFPHGVFFVPLIALETNQSIIPSIARATGLIFRQDGPSPQKQLLDYLKGKKILIILNSFETFVHSADLLPAIHFQANEVKLLVTSRHRLPLNEAWVVEIDGLDYPGNSQKILKSFCLTARSNYFSSLLAGQWVNINSTIRSARRLPRHPTPGRYASRSGTGCHLDQNALLSGDC